MRGLTLRVTNTTSAPLTVTDVTGLATFAVGETRDILYVDDVQNSLEYGRLNALIIAGSVTVLFVSGTNLNLVPVGRTFTGATTTAVGERGLVPQAAITNRGSFLRGDALWTNVTPTSIGAIPESKLTTQGDLLVRGVTTSERLPLGTLGQLLKSGPVQVTWLDAARTGLFADLPSPTALYSGTFYYATDTTVLYVCINNGVGWIWAGVNLAGAWDTFPTGGIPTFIADVTHVGRAAVGVSPASSIPAGIQFQVLGSTLLDRVFLSQVAAAAADIATANQLWASSVTLGNYSRPNGYSDRQFDLPGLVRKTIPDPEVIYIPDGSQYLCYGSLTLVGTATLTLLGDADLAIVSDPPTPVLPWTVALPLTHVATAGAVVTPILNVTTTPNKGHALDLFFSATRTDRGAQFSWRVLATVTNAAGVITVRDVALTPSGVTAWTVDVATFGADIQLTVQGAAVTDIDWTVTGTMLVHGS